eukprot:Selendium_serpulae@DN9610_c0_g1_i1.p1
MLQSDLTNQSSPLHSSRVAAVGPQQFSRSLFREVTARATEVVAGGHGWELNTNSKKISDGILPQAEEPTVSEANGELIQLPSSCSGSSNSSGSSNTFSTSIAFSSSCASSSSSSSTFTPSSNNVVSLPLPVSYD